MGVATEDKSCRALKAFDPARAGHRGFRRECALDMSRRLAALAVGAGLQIPDLDRTLAGTRLLGCRVVDAG